MTPESMIRDQLCAYLTLRYPTRCFFFVHDSVGIYNPTRKAFMVSRNRYRVKGVADILGIFDGKPMAIEVKSKTGRVSPDQAAFLDRWREAGGLACVSRSLEQLQGCIAVWCDSTGGVQSEKT